MNFDPKVNPQAKDILQGLNEFKKALAKQASFTKDELIKGFKEIGLPSNIHFWSTVLGFELPIQKCKLITRVRKNTYVFTKPKEPISWIDLEQLHNAYRQLCRKYSSNYYKKKKAETPSQVVTKNDSQIQEAIKLLKSHGYEIFIPVQYMKV